MFYGSLQCDHFDFFFYRSFAAYAIGGVMFWRSGHVVFRGGCRDSVAAACFGLEFTIDDYAIPLLLFG